MKINHKFFSKLALNLAENNLGKTKLNPSVGCVIVKNNSIISSGNTSKNGRPHAEFNALNKNLNFNNSTMYTSLEPCTHFGLTPPCTKIIKRKKIKKVFYSFEDPDIRTHKKAKKVLNKYKILNKRIEIKNNLYKSYFLNKKFNLPLIDAKIAISKDFFTTNLKNKWITNSKSRRIGHLIRSRYDCIISTSRSINNDNALMNCRINGFDNNKPDLFIVDLKLRLKKSLKLFALANKRKTYIITCSKNNKKIRFLKRNKIRIINIIDLKSKNDFSILFNKIFFLGYGRILVETGITFLSELIKFKFIHNLYLFKSKNVLGKNGLNKVNPSLIRKNKLKKLVKVNLLEDKLYRIRKK